MQYYIRMATIHDSKYGTTRVLSASTYTAKQMKTMYYSLIIILFTFQIPSAEPLCLAFETIQDYVVGKPQPVAVRVYENNKDSDADCVKFYHPNSDVTMLASVCEGQTCVCAAGECRFG